MNHKQEESKGLRLGLTITKLLLKAAAVTAAFCLVEEVHKVHKSIEAHK